MKLPGFSKVFLGVMGLYALYGGLLFFFQRRILFPGFMVGAAPEGLTLPGYVEEVWLQTSFGPVEAYWMLPDKAAPARPVPVVLFAHGNGERIDMWPETLSPFLDMGAGVFLVEYPGYGKSAGSPSQKTVTEVFLAAYDVLLSRKEVDAERIVLMGRSLGGGAVCALAAHRPARALILMSTFTSVRSLASRFLMPAVLVRDPFDNLSVVRAYSQPVLIIHGTRDETIPYRHGVTLFKNAKNAKMISYEAGHNDCPPDWDAFFRDVEAFLEASGVLP